MKRFLFALLALTSTAFPQAAVKYDPATNALVVPSASAFRNANGLQLGVNVQAYDADLDTWATKTAPSGTVVGTSDTQTISNKTISGASNTITNLSLTTGVTGVLPVVNGGSGKSSASRQLSVLDSDSEDIYASTDFFPVSGMSFTVGANETWRFQVQALLNGASSTPGFRWTLDGTETAAVMYFDAKSALNAGVTQSVRIGFGNTGSEASQEWMLVTLTGTIKNGATPQTVSFHIGQESSSGDAVRVKAGSFIEATRKD